MTARAPDPADRPDGYRERPVGGPRLRSDIVDVYLFRARDGGPGSAEFLQLFRAGDPLGDTWQPVMGHVEPMETAVQCAVRELSEEVGLRPDDPAILGFWALEQAHPYYVVAIDAIVLSPRFACRVREGWAPILNGEHTAHRWVKLADVERMFMWPGQKRACEEIAAELLRPGSLAEERLRVPF